MTEPEQQPQAPLETERVRAHARRVLDSDSFGRLYAAPVELRSFEQDAGATNRQTFRMETAALFTVEGGKIEDLRFQGQVDELRAWNAATGSSPISR